MPRNMNVWSNLNAILFILFFFITVNKKFYSYKLKINLNLIILITLIIFIVVNGIPFGIISLKLVLAIILTLFLICRIIYKIESIKSFIYSAIHTLLYILINESIYWFLQLFLYKFKYVNLLEINLFLTFIIFLVYSYLFKYFKYTYNKQKYYIYTILMIVVNILTVLFLNIGSEKIGDLYTIVLNNNIKYNYDENIMMFSLFMKNTFPYFLFIINIILIYICINSIKVEKEKVKRDFINEKLDMQHKYYLMIKESQEKMKQVYHDMNNHIENIKLLKNNSQEVNTYIESIENEVKSIKNIYNTGNSLLDIILYEKNRNCIKNNIDFTVGIDFRKCAFIDMIDISSIFTNLIDNAIEACKKIDNKNMKKYITIKGTFIKGYYMVMCENSKTNNVIIKNNKFYTSKKEKFKHGIGIESIKSSVKKYNGEFRIKDCKLKFIVNIYIPIERKINKNI